eukprot:Partr_v1_DN28767_c0_g1_i1_m63248 putative WD repeat domain phosphoinositide-interacting protein
MHAKVLASQLILYNLTLIRVEFPDGGIVISAMLNRSNYIALVGGGSNPRFPPTKVMIWDCSARQIVIEMEFRNEVHAVHLRKDTIVVVLINHVHVFSFESIPQRLTSYDTSSNPEGVSALSPHSANGTLAFPARKTGHVQVVDVLEGRTLAGDVVKYIGAGASAIIPAHNSQIACLALNKRGSLLATASNTGTLVRIFDTSTGGLCHELRRGTDQAEIWSISFNHDSSMVCLGSDKGTCHIFNLSAVASASQNAQRVIVNRQSSLSFIKDMLPKYFSSEWSFAHCRVPSEARFLCAFGADQDNVIGTYQS